MKKFNLIIVSFFILTSSFIFSNLESTINNTIAVKVGSSLITTIDIQNQIMTNLIINGIEINQENINNNKNYAIKYLINKTIKKNEIDKFKIKNYSREDLKKYIEITAKNLNTDINGLKKIFKEYNISFEVFEKNYKLELLWNTLIFKIYSNQTNINIVEVDNEIKKIKENKNEEELKIIREEILSKKKIDKLNLFSRSHFSNLENNAILKFL
tara:strand:+ start:221 stop:859 length:639 start_codon:yes stop_codon:yes gene_type:complete